VLIVPRATRTLAVAAALALLAGCAPTPIAPPVESGIPTGFEAIYAQQVFWNDCGDTGFDCTTVSAPVDWSDPESDRIQLAVVRQESTNTTKGSVLTNPGGPGGSGFDFVSFGYAVTPAAKADYDVIGWDPRGVGRSTRVTCFTDPAQTDELLYGPEGDYDAEGAAFADACGANSGELLAHMDTASNARDMDLIRAVVASEKLNYVGYSYGAFLGTVYAQLFPQNVGAMVLDGPYDPTLTRFGIFEGQSVGYDAAFRSYVESCLRDPGCLFTGSVDNAVAQAAALIASADTTRLKNDDGRVLDSATLATAVTSSLFSVQYWDSLSALLRAASTGDPGPAFAAADSANGRYSDGTYALNSLEVYTAVSCSDGPADDQSVADRLAQLEDAAPVVGGAFARVDFARVESACENWPVAPAGLPASWSATGAPTILVVGTTNDPATPYSWAQALVGELDDAVLVTRNGDGHTGYNKGNACVDAAVDAFLLDGTVPASDPNC